ncbi:SDR family NAD(P)-dependent oxidoreductase [Paenibacillus larvae]
MSMQQNDNQNGLEVAVIGMSCRFPGARNVLEFWENLKNGKDCISFFTDEQLRQSGIEKELIDNPDYVRAKGIIGDAEMFEPSFFGYTPTEAALMDPQIRVFHECVWTALEDAGYDPKTYLRPIGLYAGSSNNIAWNARTLLSDMEIDEFSKSMLSDKDLIAQLVAYKLNLTGPVYTVQAACATSLAAIHLACQSLIGGECDMALAGGVSITVPEQQGYLYYENMHESPDGRNRAFDADARGTVFSNGAGVAVLKMLEDAIADGDHIYAVIKGSAVTNDGSRKTGFTAPSPQGQAEVIKAALKVADVEPESIGYLEAHGTATPIGDPIEIEALKMAFQSKDKGFCQIGSVKTNIGHLDAAAGIAGFIKTVLTLKNRQIPPSLHYNEANPRIDFENSPFRVARHLHSWNREIPFRAGVSSFGIGGTNSHIILEEPPKWYGMNPEKKEAADSPELILLSAKTEPSLELMKENLTAHLSEHPDTHLADAAFTLQTGRRYFPYRSYFIGTNSHDAAEAMKPGSRRIRSNKSGDEVPSVIFIFSVPNEPFGYIKLGFDFYQEEKRFRIRMDECFEILNRVYGQDLKSIMYSGNSDLKAGYQEGYEDSLKFSISYSLASLLIEWGIEPAAAMGDRIGGIICACLSGTLTLEQGLRLVKANEDIPGTPKELTGTLSLPVPIPYTRIGDDKHQSAMLAKKDKAIFIELGANGDLTDIAHHYFSDRPEKVMIHPVRNDNEPLSYSKYAIQVLGECWLHGIVPKWDRFYQNKKRFRVPLPGYSFNRQLYTIEDASYPRLKNSLLCQPISKNPKISEWFYIPEWESCFLLSQKNTRQEDGLWLFFIDETGLGQQVADRMKQEGHEVITVRQGREFDKKGTGSYQIDPGVYDNYISLIDDALSTGKTLKNIVHMWSISAGLDTRLDKKIVEDAQVSGFYSLIHLAGALRKQNIPGQIHIDVVSNNSMDVTKNEVLRPEKATILGLCKVIPQEFQHISCRYMDIEFTEDRVSSRHSAQLMNEIRSEAAEPVVAYRGNNRWVQTFKPILLDEPKREILPLKEEGVYLITGGLGRVGYALAEYLAREWKAKLVLTGNSPIPDKEEWQRWLECHEEQEPTSDKIRKLQQLEQAGASILACRANVADEEQMRAVFSKAEKQFGKVDGIIHAAGAKDDGLGLMENGDKEACEKQFIPKIYGLMVLADILREKETDFCLLTSSVASVLGGLGHGAYSAANIFMDMFTKKVQQESNIPWISVNWDSWRIFEEETIESIGTEVVQLAMTPEEGIQVLERVLHAKEIGQIVISTSDLQGRIDRWIKMETFREEGKGLQETSRLPEGINNKEELGTREQVEDSLIRIWQQVLGSPDISTAANFFELGGDSLKAVTILSILRKKYNLTIPLAEFIKAASIQHLSDYILGQKKETTVPIPLAEKRDYYPLSSAQRRIFTLERIRDMGTSYNIPYAFILDGTVDKDKIERAFQALVQRHESLRTSFDYRNGEPVQIIHESVQFQIHYEEHQIQKAEEIIERYICPFDLGTAPLFRVMLVKQSEHKHLLLIDIHHLVTDGTSIGLMTKEFLDLYQGVGIPNQRLQYKDYAVWHNKLLESGKMQKQKEYWLDKFAGEIPVLNIPMDYERSFMQSFEGNSVSFSIDPETTDKLRTLAKEEDVSLYMLTFALFNALLYKISGQQDIIVGTVASGRTHEDLDKMLGMFINTLALRTFPAGSKIFIEYLREVKKTVLDAFDNQDFQFDQLVEELNPQVDPGRNTIFDILFEWQNIDSEDLTLKDIRITKVPFEHKISQFDISFIGWEASDQLVFEIMYRTQLFRKESIGKFITFFKEITQQIIESRNIALKKIEISHDLVAAQSRKERIEFDF